MVYVMSDIHGESDRFQKMLELIQFSADDTLYIIGDVADRYPGGVELWEEIMQTPNMILLKGNHEDMCVKTLGRNSEFGMRDLWRQNGGNHTYRELLYMTSPAQRDRILRWLEALPVGLDITVQDRHFRLVHGWPGQNTETCLWGRPTDGTPMDLPDNFMAIIGHTPTPYLTGNAENAFRVYYGYRYVAIDCGCGNETPNRRLACLRLDDMEEFYT